MSNLKRPSNPAVLTEVTYNELMRLSMDGKPIVGMMVGHGTQHAVLVYIGADGSVSSVIMGNNNTKVRFVDYLTTEDKIEISGSAEDQDDGSVDKTPIDQAVAILLADKGDSDLRHFPNYTPFFSTGEYQEKRVCMLGYVGGRRCIYTMTLSRNGQPNGSGYDYYDDAQFDRADDYVRRTYKFDSAAPMSMYALMKEHHAMRESIKNWP